MADPKIVDSYSIELRERGGFTFVVVNVLTDDQKTESFEFAPAFAYQLSDELLRASAKAAPRAGGSLNLGQGEPQTDPGLRGRQRGA